MSKKSLIHVFLSEETKPTKPAVPSKTNKNIDKLKKKVDTKKVDDVNKELEDYKSILEGPFDDAYAEHEKGIEDKAAVVKRDQNKKQLVKLDDPFTNNLKECGFDMDSPEHEAMETPEEEAQEHMPGGSEYDLEEPEDYITITVGHSADEKMSKTGMPAFDIGKRNSFGAPGGPNFKDGIDDDLNEGKESSINNPFDLDYDGLDYDDIHGKDRDRDDDEYLRGQDEDDSLNDDDDDLKEAGFGKTISNFGKNVAGAVGNAAHWATTPKKQLDKEKRQKAAKLAAGKKHWADIAAQNDEWSSQQSAVNAQNSQNEKERQATRDYWANDPENQRKIKNQKEKQARDNEVQNVRTQRGPNGQTGTGSGGAWTRNDANNLARDEQERAKKNRVPDEKTGVRAAWESVEHKGEKEADVMQESFNPKRWQKLAGILKECPMEDAKMASKKDDTLMEMDPFNGLSDDPEFDEDGMPIEDDEELEDSDDQETSMFDKFSSRLGKK